MDATVDADGTAHLCMVDAGNIVHVQVDTAGTQTLTEVGSGDDCSLAIDATGKLHLLSSLGAVINHATFE